MSNFQPLSAPKLILVGLMVMTIWTACLHGSEYVCPSGWELFSSSCYYIEADTITLAVASTACQGYGATLAEITSVEENAYIENDIGKDTALWIDCTDAISEGDWVCGDDNHIITYTGWNPGEPNDVDNEDCIVTYNGVWYDIPCSSQLSAVCKKDAEATPRSMTFKRFDSNPAYCLQNNVIETIRPTTLIYCAGRCLKSGECASFNYTSRGKKCELNSITRAETDDSHFIEIPNCAYYDIVS